jgi:hypothetical protein
MVILLSPAIPGHQTMRTDMIPVTCHASLALRFLQDLLNVKTSASESSHGVRWWMFERHSRAGQMFVSVLGQV